MRYFTLLICTALLLFFTACDDGPKGADKGPAKKAATTAKAKPTAKTAAKEPDSELDDEDIPVAEDYEEKAETEINKDNLEEELAKLEKELADNPDGEEKADEKPEEKKN